MSPPHYLDPIIMSNMNYNRINKLLFKIMTDGIQTSRMTYNENFITRTPI